jgi:hypothetical protein
VVVLPVVPHVVSPAGGDHEQVAVAVFGGHGFQPLADHVVVLRMVAEQLKCLRQGGWMLLL